MLRHRLALGPLLAIAAVVLLWLDERLATATDAAGLVLATGLASIASLAAAELSAMLRRHGVDAPTWLLAVAAVLPLAAAVPAPLLAPGIAAGSIATAGVGGLLCALGRAALRRDSGGATLAAAGASLATGYLGLLGACVVLLRHETSAWTLLGVLVVTKGCDIGAYFAGRAVGRHKLIPWLSPGKTWEGLAGGVLFAAALGAAAAATAGAVGHTPVATISPLVGAALGGIFGIVGQAGDLVASMLKRDAGVKDSSSVLPGFGGVIDVIDSPLLVAPVAYWALALATP